MAQGKRFLLYCQHLSGSGHCVRMFEIARALTQGHDVNLVAGGRPMPRTTPAVPFAFVLLPQIYRSANGIDSVDPTQTIDQVMRERRQSLFTAVEKIQPDFILVEHFPFSKWQLYPEIIPVIQRARAVNEQIKVICSLRDISPPTRYDPCSVRYQRDVIRTLQEQFDRLLIHADPQLIRLEEHIPWANQIDVPIDYTGYVSEKPDLSAAHKNMLRNRHGHGARTVVLSGEGRKRIVNNSLH